MNRRVYAAILPVFGLAVWAMAQTPGDPLIEGLRNVEVASVADAIEQLYGQKAYMSHDMRPLAKTKFAGPAVTVLLKKEEHTEGSKASQGMLDAIDSSPAGSVYVMVLENGLDYAGMGGLMATAMKARGFTAAVIDGGVRDTPQIGRMQFPVFSRGVVPSTTINHFRFAGVNIPVTCAGATRQSRRYHRGRRRWRGRGAEGASRRRAQEGRRTRQHGTHHDAVHREVQVDQGSGRQVRPHLVRATHDIVHTDQSRDRQGAVSSVLRSNRVITNGRIKQSLAYWCLNATEWQWNIDRICETAVRLGCRASNWRRRRHGPSCTSTACATRWRTMACRIPCSPGA